MLNDYKHTPKKCCWSNVLGNKFLGFVQRSTTQKVSTDEVHLVLAHKIRRRRKSIGLILYVLAHSNILLLKGFWSGFVQM